MDVLKAPDTSAPHFTDGIVGFVERFESWQFGLDEKRERFDRQCAGQFIGDLPAAVTLDPLAVGAAQQMLADNQFFASIAELLRDNRLRAVFGLLTVPDDYETIRAQPASTHRLPMSWDQQDTVFADEEDGVVAIKRGTEILYVSLYWRSRQGINGLARTHHLTPHYQQVAVVYEDVKFEPSGRTWKRPNWINFGFANDGHRYPVKLDSAHADEELPIPKLPADVHPKAGQDNPYPGARRFLSAPLRPLPHRHEHDQGKDLRS